jgi:SAM-dependent methyltransferase
MPAPDCACCAASLADATRICGRDRLHGLADDVEVAICRQCGSGLTLPELPAAKLGELYPAEYGPYGLPPRGIARSASRIIRCYQGRRALRTAPIRAISARSSGRAVDVGCGRGDLGATLIGEGWRVTGVEPSPAACAVATARGLDARQGTLADVRLETAGYDAAVFMHSLEHIDRPVHHLEAVRDALRPDGVVLITVPNFGGWQARRFRGRWFHLDLARHRIHFTRSGLTHALTRAGFEPEELTTSSSPVGLPASIQYALAGRCLFPSGNALRVAIALSTLAYPFVALGDRFCGEGDLLHAVARNPAA